MAEGGDGPLGCRLYLVTPLDLATGRLDADAFAPMLAAAMDAGDVASLLLRLPGASEDAIRRAAERLRPVAQDRGIAFLLGDRPDLVAVTGADGVHLDRTDANLAAARRALGPDLILGASCAASRHQAMVAAEQGADYVAFGDPGGIDEEAFDWEEIADLVEWWGELMTVPCVAFGRYTLDEAGLLARAGADFVALGASVWEWPEGAPAAVRAYDAALAMGVENREPPAA